jgi:hypothetical protein
MAIISETSPCYASGSLDRRRWFIPPDEMNASVFEKGADSIRFKFCSRYANLRSGWDINRHYPHSIAVLNKARRKTKRILRFRKELIRYLWLQHNLFS